MSGHLRRAPDRPAPVRQARGGPVHDLRPGAHPGGGERRPAGYDRPDTSLLGGLIIIATLVVLNLVVARLARLDAFHRFFSASPTVVIKDGRSLEPDGTISIVPKDGQTIRSKRRVRYRRF
jgi:hypothetical protein